MASFSAQIDEWVRKSDARMLAVAKESTQRTVSKAQELVPVDTGFTRASIRASTESMPQIEQDSRGAAGQSYTYNSGEITLTIAGLELGGTIWVGYTSSYAIFLEWGHSSQAPAGFVGLAALAWPATVRDVVAELKNRV